MTASRCKTRFRLLIAIAALVTATLADAAVPSALTPVPAGKITRQKFDIKSQATPIGINRAALAKLAVQDEMEFALPNGTRYMVVFDRIEDHGGGIRSSVGYLKDHGKDFRVIITSGPSGTFGTITTPETIYRIIPGEGHDWMVDETEERKLIPPIDLGDDMPRAPVAPSAGKVGNVAPAAEMSAKAWPGVDIALAVAPPTQATIDLMIVYTNGLAARLGANLMTRLYNLVTSANTAYTDSEVAITLRLVNATMVTYPDNTNDSGALYAISPARAEFNAAVFGNIETIRSSVGADLVSFLRSGGDNNGSGIAWLSPITPDPQYLYSTLNGCVVGCNSVFIHEVGHNMGNAHDRATAAYQSGNPNPTAGAYPYSFGHYFCASGLLTCNPFVAGGCATQPQCTTNGVNTGNVGTIMSYFNPVTLKFSNPNLQCAPADGGVPLQACGVAGLEDNALSMNNMRTTLQNVKATAVSSLPGSIQFSAASYSAAETSGLASITVSRVGGSSGNISASYSTTDGSAKKGYDYSDPPGPLTLTWLDGDSSDKTISIPIVNDGVTEGTESFTVTLSNPGGATGVFLGYPTSVSVQITEATPWPPGDVFPVGYVTPGTSTGSWTTATDFAYEGTTSLRSAQMVGNGTTYATSDVTYTGNLAAGIVSFAYRVSSYGGVPGFTSYGFFDFILDGTTLVTDTGESGWKFVSFPIATAGTHTLIWRYRNRLSARCNIGFVPAPPGGSNCADRAWIDAVSLPLVLAISSTAIGSSVNPSTSGQSVTFTATASGIAGIPAGVMTFRDGSNILCNLVPLNGSGQAPCITSALTTGAHSITAAYSGNTTYDVSTSPVFTQNVNGFLLTAARAGTGSGTVTGGTINCGVTCTQSVGAGTLITLTATPSVGSTFAGWSGGGCSGTGTCAVTVNATTTVTATFNLQAFNLTIAPSGNGSGTVTSNPAAINCGATCVAPFNFGTMVTLTAVAATGSTFSGWSGGGCSGIAPCTTTIAAATSVTATFTLQSFNLAITPAGAGNGTVTSSPGGINCGGSCNSPFNFGTMVTLSAAATGGSVFGGWSGGGCSGTAPCAVTIAAATAVTATFNVALTAPGAPTIVSAISGNGLAVIAFSPPASNGGTAIIDYTVSCAGGGTFTTTAASSPITVAALSNGSVYSCSVTARNSVGSGPASASLNVTPANLGLSSVVSRKVHPFIGNCDVPIALGVPIAGAIAVEPRATASHTLLMTFNGLVNTVGAITVQDASLANIGSALLSPATGGNTLTATLSGIPDNKRVTVSLTGLNGTTGATFALGFLVGDISGNGFVNAADIIAVKAQGNQSFAAANCRMDFNLTGSITAQDVSAAKARSGLVLP